MVELIQIILKSLAPVTGKWDSIKSIICKFFENREKFFGQLIVSSKLATTMELVKKVLLKGHSVMIGMEIDEFVYQFLSKNGGRKQVFEGMACSSLM